MFQRSPLFDTAVSIHRSSQVPAIFNVKSQIGLIGIDAAGQVKSIPIFEQYGLISPELENSILDNFAIQLLDDPNLAGRVLLRRGQHSSKFAGKKLLPIKNYLLKKRHVPANRVSAFEGQRGRDFTVELYLLPKKRVSSQTRSPIFR